MALIGKECGDITDLIKGFLLRGCDYMCNTTIFTMRFGAAKRCHINIFTSYRFNNIGTCNKDSSFRSKDNDVGKCWSVCATTSRWSKYER